MLDHYKMTMCALLWLRNHYDVGSPELKQDVLAVIDAILDSSNITIVDIAEFRKTYIQGRGKNNA